MCRDAGQGQPAPLVGLLILGDDVVTKQPQETDTQRPRVPTAAAAAAKSLQSCPTLCDPIDGSPPGSSVPGILQVRTLEWAAISSSNA